MFSLDQVEDILLLYINGLLSMDILKAKAITHKNFMPHMLSIWYDIFKIWQNFKSHWAEKPHTIHYLNDLNSIFALMSTLYLTEFQNFKPYIL